MGVMKKLFIGLVFLISGCQSNPLHIDRVNFDRNKDLISNILSEYNGALLAPSDVASMTKQPIPEGYAYKIVEHFDHIPEEPSKYTQLVKYHGSVDGGHYFASHMTHVFKAGPESFQAHFKLENGERYVYSSRDNKYHKDEGWDCYFVLGECQYYFSAGKRYIPVDTSIKNGLWITDRTTRIGVRVRHVRAFDKWGLPVLNLNFSSNAKNAHYYVREPLSVDDLELLKGMSIKL